MLLHIKKHYFIKFCCLFLKSLKVFSVYLSKNLDFYLTKNESFFVIGDFNAELTKKYLEEFCASYSLQNLIKQPTCLKN